jgi:ATP-dependent DNA ligase I
MRLVELVDTSRSVAATRSRKAKTAALAACVTAANSPAVARLAVAYLVGQMPQGRIGIGGATLRKVAGAVTPAADATLTLADVDGALAAIASHAGPGTVAAREAAFAEILGRATREEQRFLVSLVGGELRQGALEGVMIEALAAAFHAAATDVRRAVMLSGDVSVVAAALAESGADAVARFRLELGRPLQPMLAQTADDTDAALESLGDTIVDAKMDGVRIQLHKMGDDVRLYSRALNDVTAAAPEIVTLARELPAHTLLLDGELIALSEERPLPFQVTMRRFGQLKDQERLRVELPLRAFFFDCLHADGDDLIDLSLRERLQALDGYVATAERMPRIETPTAVQAAAFAEAVFAQGHEGVMVKAAGSAYAAGMRGSAWLKIKRAIHLDLVILAAEWGSGRRRGWLSNLHLGARDPQSGAFVMLGKTFKGLTDATLAWQTEALLAREIGRDDWTVYVRPELVAEIAFNEIQASPRYPAGLALRFARVKRYRTDKTAAQADTIDTVRALHERATALT